MKKSMISTMIAIALMAGVASSQVQAEKSTTELKAELAAMQTRVAAAEMRDTAPLSKIAGFGREVGFAYNGFVEALDGGLKVTTVRVNEFAKTDVGKFAMIGIGWKIFAEDLIDLSSQFFKKVVGFMFFGLFIYILNLGIRIFYIGRMVVMKREGPWYDRKITKERTQPLIERLKASSEYQNNSIGFTGAIIIISLVVTFISAIANLT